MLLASGGLGTAECNHFAPNACSAKVRSPAMKDARSTDDGAPAIPSTFLIG